MKRILTACAAALALSTLGLAPQASAATAASACSGAHQYEVAHVKKSVDWLLVHKTPGSDAVVGQIASGKAFYLCGGVSGGWTHGFGYNGGKKLTGWVWTNYIG